MIGLPGVAPVVVPEPSPGPERDRYGKIPTKEHRFKGGDYPCEAVYTAEQVLNEVENRCHCTIGPLPVILFRKGIITGDEFLESIHARDFTFVG